ncbi:MAG: thiolase family protein, partial [Bacteroidales bacterium]|nr:thiolase family protein [Bacteroidales bacterium]
EQDEFALWSYRKYFQAKQGHVFEDEITPIPVKPSYDSVLTEDEGIRENQDMKSLAKLRPFFDRTDGTVTIGNSCSITDGAASVLVMSEDKANSMQLEPLGYINEYAFAALDPSIMGLGPAHACSELFQKTKSKTDDYDLVEINEAFAAQVIANERAFASTEFAQKHLGRKTALGEIDRSKLNVNGGAIAMGHPVGMTGTRIILHTLKELKRRNQKKGLATLCVGGGQGFAVELEAA